MEPGNFDALPLAENEKILLKDAWRAVSLADKWEWLRDTTILSFLYKPMPEIELIISNMRMISEHKNDSFSWTLRTMEYIAKHGWLKYASHVMNG